MNQGILWTVIIVVVLIIGGVVLWNFQSQPSLETPSPLPTLEITIPTPEPTLEPTFAPPTPSVSVSTQKPGRSVTIDAATLTTNGFIAIHTDKDGKPGPVIGNSDLLPPGSPTGTTVKLSRSSRKGETLYAMLHTDVDGDGIYTFPGPDVPTTDSAGAVVVVPFAIGTPSVSPAAPAGSPQSSPTAAPLTGSTPAPTSVSY